MDWNQNGIQNPFYSVVWQISKTNLILSCRVWLSLLKQSILPF